MNIIYPLILVDWGQKMASLVLGQRHS